MALESTKKALRSYNNSDISPADIIKETNSHVKRASEPRSHLWASERTVDAVAPEAAGTGESNKQMRRIGVEWQNVVYQSSAASAL